MRFTNGNPFAVLPYSGISNILRLNTLPLLEKSRSSSCVLHKKACSMKSPSLVSPPFTPLPPLFCALYVSGGSRLTYPVCVIVTKVSSEATISSSDISSILPLTTFVLLSSPCLVLISSKSVLIISKIFD